ncbi:MAG: sugar porter family MFS transporter [Rubripirellula sp.]
MTEIENPSDWRPFYLWRICLVVAMGGLLFGYDWVVIGGAKPFYEPFLGISQSPMLQGWAMSSALFGCLGGAVVSGVMADRLGRKPLLVFSAMLFIASAIGTALSPHLFVFALFRLVGGVGIGLASNLSPLFIAEIAPASSRGRLVAINQLTIVIGVLAAQVANLMIAHEVPDGATAAMIAGSWNGTDGWRWMFAAESIPAMVFFGLMFGVPESPRWLVQVGKIDRAMHTLRRIGGPDYADAEMRVIKETLEPTDGVTESPGKNRLRGNVLAIGVFLAVFQQWCGINVIFNYAQEIFSAAGYGISSIMLNIVITGIVNLIFTFVAIMTVDKLGRRSLLLFGAGGLAIIYAALGACFFFHSQGLHVLLLIVVAIACYAMSLAPIVWVVISEIFPSRDRGRLLAIAVFSLWLACAILTFTFPILNQRLGAHGIFWLYGFICVIGFVVVWWKLPETKGKSLEAIERSFAAARGGGKVE